MPKTRKLNPPLSLRLTPAMEEEVEKLATANGLNVTSQLRMLLIRGLRGGSPKSHKPVKTK